MQAVQKRKYAQAQEEKKTVHTVRHHGQAIVIGRIPAEMGSFCEQVLLLKPETVRRIAKFLQKEVKPTKSRLFMIILNKIENRILAEPTE